MTRRELLALGAGVVSLAGAVTAAGPDDATGRLRSRLPATPPTGASATGAQPLGLDPGRDGVVYVPDGLTGPAPFLLLLHGAADSAAGILGRTNAFAHADASKMVVVAPDSRKATWDAIRGGFGPDVAFIDRALAAVFSTVPIDPTRIAVAGFADGASYALSLGLVNGDLFTGVVAFSPGSFLGDERHGTPAFFVSHGRQDEILPIDATSGRLVPLLEDAGYDVTYREFDGPHGIPAAIATEAFAWMAGKKDQP